MDRRYFLTSLASLAGCSGVDSPFVRRVEPIPQQLDRAIYYDTNKAEIKLQFITDLDEIVAAKPRTVLLEGYCDERGGLEFNYKLGIRRAKGVEEYLASHGVTDIESVSYGKTKSVAEGSHEDAWSKNRRVLIIVDANPVMRGLKLNEAQAYLIDATDSMTARMKGHGMSRWDAVSNYAYPKDSDLYVFSSAMTPWDWNNPKTVFPHGQYIAKVDSIKGRRPRGGTPLWAAITNFVNAHDYRTITVLTDGDNKLRGTMEQALAAAKERKSIINMIGIGEINDESRKQMRMLASETGGNFYVTNK